MEDCKELASVVKKLKMILDGVKDDQTYDTLSSYISELEDRYEQQISEFNQYYKQG